tara:strand:+ start:327 stop:467 length:141 start_codon:yes stop_codon:yes gene_type:complete
MESKNQGFIEAITQLTDLVKELQKENQELREALADEEAMRLLNLDS